MPRAKEQRLCTRVKPLVIFIIETVASLFDFCDRENVHFISRKAYVTDSKLLSQRILPRYCVFKSCEISMFDTPVVGICSGKKQCLSQAIYFHISNF